MFALQIFYKKWYPSLIPPLSSTSVCRAVYSNKTLNGFHGLLLFTWWRILMINHVKRGPHSIERATRETNFSTKRYCLYLLTTLNGDTHSRFALFCLIFNSLSFPWNFVCSVWIYLDRCKHAGTQSFFLRHLHCFYWSVNSYCFEVTGTRQLESDNIVKTINIVCYFLGKAFIDFRPPSELETRYSS